MPEPGRYLAAVGWVEVMAGLLLAFGPQLLQEISNFILSVVMIGESQWAPAAHRGVLGHPCPETPIVMLCSMPRCHLHAAGAAGAAGHVCPGHPLPRPPPAAQHPWVSSCPPAQVRVTRGGKDRRLSRWGATPSWNFQGQRHILQGSLLMRHSVSSPASASDSGAGCRLTVGPGLVLWDGGRGTAVTLPWHCSGSSAAELAQSVWLFPVFGHTKQGLALLSWGLSNFGIKPLVFHILPLCLFLPSPYAEPWELRGCPGAGGPSPWGQCLDTRPGDVWEIVQELAQRQMDSGESPLGSLNHPHPPNNVPGGPLLYTQGATGVSAQAGMYFLWILLPQGASLCHPNGHSMLGTNHSSPGVSPSKGAGLAVWGVWLLGRARGVRHPCTPGGT